MEICKVDGEGDFKEIVLTSGNRTLTFLRSQSAQDYWTAQGGMPNGPHAATWYTVVGPAPLSYTAQYGLLPEASSYTHPDFWTASRANEFVDQLLGKFYLRRFPSREGAMRACANDFEAVQRLYGWIEHFKTHDAPVG